MDDNSLLQLYIGYTLVDITKTNITSAKESQDNPKGRNQQRNWETLVQILSLRAQLMVLGNPFTFDDDVKMYNFGSEFTGRHKIWTFKFGVEAAGVYDGATPFETLRKDCDAVPIITNLTETVAITPSMFIVDGPKRNVYFEVFKT